MLGLLQRHRPQIQEDIAQKVVLKYTPRLSFALDTSLEEGDRVLTLLSTLEPDRTAPNAPEPESTPGAETGRPAEKEEKQ
jgi:hypothetical protein